MADRSDEALVSALAAGDERALAELYERYGALAYRLAHRILRDANLAEDAVQEAFLCVWRGASTFDAARGSASTWLLTLVHRRAVDLVRHSERRRAEALDEPAAGEAGSAEEDVWLRFERRRVQAALADLPDSQRELLELAYYGGLTQSQIAERLGEPLGTVKSRMFAGLARLRELLAEAPDAEPAAVRA
jgi:RNA polymerase sigma-70 factor (ECF subfamily)